MKKTFITIFMLKILKKCLKRLHFIGLCYKIYRSVKIKGDKGEYEYRGNKRNGKKIYK